jgi:parallel beta-helix repeat protein
MNTIMKFLVALALPLIQQYAYATTYYINSQLGDDSWSGKLPAAISNPSPDGPWQSLNRLANTQLLPGDIIELQCGSKWTQTLRLKNSGTSDRPITIRPTSTTCGVPPSIDGSQSVDAHSWVPRSNAIYRTVWPVQKFQNGSLASGVTGWTSWSASADQKLVYEPNCPDSSGGCAAFTSSTKPGGSVLISNEFMVDGGIAYNGGISLRIPAGSKIKALVRRGSPPYEPISAVQWITGTGAWQKINIAFTPRYSLTNARLDIEEGPAGMTYHFKGASLTSAFAKPLGAWVGDLPLLPAYHPNRGYDATRPTSVYATTAANGNAVRNNIGVTGSNYLDIDSTLKLPAGTTLKAGNQLRIRTAPWHLDDVTITKVEGNRLYFDPVTRYQIQSGQGYFVLGELGMLDSPGEWLYDSNTGSAYAWAPDSNTPSNQIRLSVLEKGVDFSGQSNITIEGIDVRYTGVGIDLTNTQNVTLNSASVTNTIREGILAAKAKNIIITSNRIRQTGGDAISAPGSTIIRVEKNDINQSGVTVAGDRIWSLPATTYSAIYTGAFANIIDNRINTSSTFGIWTQAEWVVANGVIERNAVLNTCLQMNDCGGIYINYSSPNTRIASNLVERVSGNVDGLGPNIRTHAIGIYLDDLATNTVVENNTIAWADHGIQVHNAYANQINGNLLHGNRNSQLWFQENTNKLASTGDLHDNKIYRNRFAPTAPAPSVAIEGLIGSLTHFGVLSENHYSALFSKRVVSESWPGRNLTYTLAQWMDASNHETRVPEDAGSSQLVQEGYATYLAAGGTIVPNGGLANGTGGWSSWNETAPFSTKTYETCSFGPCLRVTAGASETLLSTPNFSVESGHVYRVSFDARTNINGNFIAPVVRRGGPTPLYERLMPASEGFAGSTEWRRYSFVFTAAKTVNAGDPTTGDLGARMDFENILPGQILWVANVEIVPLLPVENTLRTQLITNPGRAPQSYDCPDQATAPEYCNQYHVFPEGTPVSWPVDLPPLGAVSIYTINQTTRDSDGDGIADSQDLCANTLTTDQVNASGCAATQVPG